MVVNSPWEITRGFFVQDFYIIVSNCLNVYAKTESVLAGGSFMMKGLVLIFIASLLLTACVDNNAVVSHTGVVTNMIEEENGMRIHVEGDNGGVDNTISFLLTEELNEGIDLHDTVTVYYDPDAFREDSLPPNQGGVESVEVNK